MWEQGAHVVKLSPDGACSSIMRGQATQRPRDQMSITFSPKWPNLECSCCRKRMGFGKISGLY